MKKNYLLLWFAATTLWSQTPDCATNVVYAIGNGTTMGNSIHKLTRTATGLTYSGQLFTLPPGDGSGIGIANFGDGEKFYTSNYNGQVRKLENGTWITLASTADGTSINNMAGRGPYLYYQKNNANFTERTILRFDGTNLFQVWNSSETYLSIADMAVDDFGNLYFFTGTNYPTNYMTDTLVVMAPDGTIVHQYPISFDTIGGYGCCFLNGKLCVFFTDSNSTYPGKMIEISITGSSATVTDQMTIPKPVVGTSTNGPIYLFLQDVETCSAALATDSFILESAVRLVSSGHFLEVQTPLDAQMTLYDIDGRPVLSSKVQQPESKIDISGLSRGTYIAKIKTDGGETARKFVK